MACFSVMNIDLYFGSGTDIENLNIQSLLPLLEKEDLKVPKNSTRKYKHFTVFMQKIKLFS